MFYMPSHERHSFNVSESHKLTLPNNDQRQRDRRGSEGQERVRGTGEGQRDRRGSEGQERVRGTGEGQRDRRGSEGQERVRGTGEGQRDRRGSEGQERVRGTGEGQRDRRGSEGQERVRGTGEGQRDRQKIIGIFVHFEGILFVGIWNVCFSPKLLIQSLAFCQHTITVRQTPVL